MQKHYHDVDNYYHGIAKRHDVDEERKRGKKFRKIEKKWI